MTGAPPAPSSASTSKTTATPPTLGMSTDALWMTVIWRWRVSAERKERPQKQHSKPMSRTGHVRGPVVQLGSRPHERGSHARDHLRRSTGGNSKSARKALLGGRRLVEEEKNRDARGNHRDCRDTATAFHRAEKTWGRTPGSPTCSTQSPQQKKRKGSDEELAPGSNAQPARWSEAKWENGVRGQIQRVCATLRRKGVR